MSITFITFATSEYHGVAKELIRRAHKLGATSTQLFTPQTIEGEKDILTLLGEVQIDYKTRGAGYWLWKPLIILSELLKLPPDSTLIYCDAGVLPTVNFDTFFSELAKTSILTWKFEQKQNEIKRWTDGTVTSYLKCSEEVLNCPMIIAGFMVLKNDNVSRAIVNYWLNLCLKSFLLHPDSKNGFSPTPGVIWHRHDQSLLSIIAAQFPNKFKITNVSASSIFRLQTPFIIHRQKNLRSYVSIYFYSFMMEVMRLCIRILPRPLRVKIRILRSKNKLNAMELKNHTSFF